MKQAQLIHNDNLRRPHDARAALACGDNFNAAAGVRSACEGWPLRREGLPDSVVFAEAAPGEHAGCKGAFELIVRLEDQHRPTGGHMAQGGGDQRGGLAALHAAAEHDLLKRGIVHGVDHFAPRRRGDAERSPGAGSVRDHDVAERPAPECAYTARGHRRGTTRQASFARLAIAAVASS